MVMDPSAAVFNPGVELPIEYRLIGLSTSQRWGSLYMVHDQKFFAGGIWSAVKVTV
jgi:hypothetical protein